MICVITEFPLREGWEFDLISRALMREGIHANKVTWLALLSERPYGGNVFAIAAHTLDARAGQLRAQLSDIQPTAILALGGYLTELLTGCSGIDKWQCSVLASSVTSGKVIPCYPPERIAKDLSLQLWVSLCARKLASVSRGEHKEPKHDFLLNPPLEEALSFLRRDCTSADLLSVDIETGRGQINTVGFAISETRAIAINVLPDRLGAQAHYELWSAIRDLLESDQPKVLQNNIYEKLYLSRYGIQLRGVTHDTMICQKFLWPEFEMGLDAVGRMYSKMPYWKDDGKSWNNIRDWEAHYEYNCKDTCGTFEGYLGQRKDLAERGLTELYDGYLAKLMPAVSEMCSWGIPLSEQALFKLRSEVGRGIEEAAASLRGLPGADSLNPKSPKQVANFLKAEPRKYSIPKKYDSKEKKHKESTDEKSLKKLRLKYPEDEALTYLLKLRKLEKAHSSYLSFGYDADKRMRYSLTAGGTETMRFAGHCDPWDNGVNPQTLPGGGKGINIKSIYEAEPGMTFLQIDLKQAESRFVAYDCADLNLITMLEDPTKDIHRYVAAEIFGKPESQITKQERQLGKKSGHGANYSVKENTFMDACLSEMDLVLSKSEAGKVLEAYHKLFPGIRNWHSRIRSELGQTRRLATPWGWERHFWGRLDDDMFRQAYAFRPQSTIPYVVNQLMLHLLKAREQGVFNFRLLLQNHDSLLLEVPAGAESDIIKAAERLSDWQPGFKLPGGHLVIPVSCETGTNLGNLGEWEG